jgi:hypothetical protein
MVVRLPDKSSKRGKTTKNAGWDEILMIILISSKKLGGYKIMRNSVHTLVFFFFFRGFGKILGVSSSTWQLLSETLAISRLFT